MVDAELYDNEGYVSFGDDSTARVKYLLGKLNADYNHKTDYFVHKFMHKVEAIFSQLPRKKEWRSFYVNDLPLIKIDEEVIEVAIGNDVFRIFRV